MTEAAATNATRRPGRPRKYGQGRINATVRFTPDRYAALKKAANKQRRSISEEIEFRVSQSFQADELVVLVNAYFGRKADIKQ